MITVAASSCSSGGAAADSMGDEMRPAAAAASSQPASSSSSSAAVWDAILLTASNESQAAAFESEVAARQQRGSLPPPSRTRVMVVCDPEGQRIGSGGATMAALHALLHSLPPESREKKLAMLKTMKIGMFHSGGDSQRLPTCSVRGKAFCGLPSAPSTSAPGAFESTPLDFLIARLASLQRCPGVLISATDCLLDFPDDYPTIEAGSEASRGVLGCTVRTPRKLGSAHGVFVVDAEAQQRAGASNACAILPVTNIMQKASQSELEQAGAVEPRSQTVLLDAGNIFLCPDAIEALLDLALEAPFNSCCRTAPADSSSPNDTGTGSSADTGSGAETGALVATNEPVGKAFRFELYTDILLPMNPSLTRAEYLSTPAPDPSTPAEVLRSARDRLWSALHVFRCFAAVHPRASFFHMGTVAERAAFMFDQDDEKCVALRRQIGFQMRAQVVFDDAEVEQGSRGAALLNVVVQSRCCDEDEEDDGKEEEAAQACPSQGSPCSHSRSGTSVLSAGSFVEYSHLRGEVSAGPGALVSGVRSEQIGAALRVPAGLCVQETQLRDGWAELLGAEQQQRQQQGQQQRAPTVVSVFHGDDPIKTVFTDPKATWMLVPLEELLTRMSSLLGRTLDEVVCLVWPGSEDGEGKAAKAKGGAQRTLWSAKLFPVFWPGTSDSQVSLWMMRLMRSDEKKSKQDNRGGDDGALGLPARSVLQQWLDAPRASFCDVLACADGRAETLWRERLACAVDVRLLRQHLFRAPAAAAAATAAEDEPAAVSVVSGVLARAHATHVLFPSERQSLLCPLFSALDRWARTCSRDARRLDVAARACWMQASLLRMLFVSPAERTALSEEEQLDVLVAQHPQLGAVQAQLARADLGDWARTLPAALSTLGSVRSAAVSRAEQGDPVGRQLAHSLHLLYGQAVAALGRCALCRPHSQEELSFLPAHGAPVLPGSVLALQGCVRVDLFGGWSDTPPVCYEQGGCVLNVAVRIDDALPLQLRASVRTVGPDEPLIVAQLGEDASDASARTELSSLGQFEDYADPAAPAALLKCVLLAMGVVTLPQPGDAASSVPDLATQLAQAYWRGKSSHVAAQHARSGSYVPLAVSSSLPRVQLTFSMWVALGEVSQGTGLGVSSLLAAYLVHLVSRMLDRTYSASGAAFLALRAEQLLTTGGGWQDQFGGLYPGFKLATSPCGLPLRLAVRSLPVSAAVVAGFNAHLLLVHTGMPRLARGLLRTVLDNWARRDPLLTALFRRLREGAVEMAAAVEQGDWPLVGRTLSDYWAIKRQLATPAPEAQLARATLPSGEAAAVAAAEATLPASVVPPAEPPHVSAFLRATADLCYGASLAGAGGGGFLVLLAPPANHSAIEAQVRLLNEQRRAELAAANDPAAATFMPYRLFKGSVCAEEHSQMQWSLSNSKQEC